MALAGLRLGVIVLVIFAMLRPTLIYTEVKKQSATLVVLADQSRSMSVPDALAGKTRWDVLRKAVADAATPLAKLARDFEVKAYAFDAEAHPLTVENGEISLPEKPEGQQTAIGSALDDVLRQEAGKRLLGVILLSDGAQRAYAPRDLPPQTAAARLKHLGFPLFTIPFGQSRGLGQAQDVAVKDLIVNPTVFVKNELTISGQVRVDGYVNAIFPCACCSRPRRARWKSSPSRPSKPTPTANCCRSNSLTSRKRPANSSSPSKCPTSPANWSPPTISSARSSTCSKAG